MDFNTKADAYWINPSGIITVVDGKHVSDILQNPEYFGFKSEYVRGLFDKYKERYGWEGKAREQLIKELLSQGWIRIRKYTRPDYFISIQTNKMTKRAKDYIQRFASEMIKDKDNRDFSVRITTQGENSEFSLFDISSDVLYNESHKLIFADFNNLDEKYYPNRKKMKNYMEYIMEAGGQEAGSMELVKTPLEKAREFAEKLFSERGENLIEQLPKFDENYINAQRIASVGWTKRKDMPVIQSDDVNLLKNRIEKGELDINKPYANPIVTNPFPQGLKGAKADRWLKYGLPVSDGGKLKDDIISVKIEKVPAANLNPIQQQIYFDKSMGMITKFGVENSKKFNTSSENIYITSSDYYIIDGHHRWLSALLLDGDMKVNCLVIDLPIEKLLKVTLSYGDAIGNSRNA